LSFQFLVLNFEFPDTILERMPGTSGGRALASQNSTLVVGKSEMT